ncbi:MAG: hypothetical protein QOE35_2981 [Actinomycetota bacterium]|jgi:hypothetical protein
MLVTTPPTEAQQQVLRDLMALGGDRPRFDPGLGHALRARLIAELNEVGRRLELAGQRLFVAKTALRKVHQCERHLVAEQDFPGWSPGSAKGSVAHKAIELAAFMPGPERPPLELVDMAIDKLIEDGTDRSPGRWLLDADAVDVSEVRSGANDLVAKFQECFPPLEKDWRPRLESSFKVELPGEVITLHAKPDLALGRVLPEQARVLIIDFKSAGASQVHIDDLRFYALVHTMRFGVPPYRVATYYLDAGSWRHEDVTIDTLEIALRRTVDGATKIAELQLHEREATFTPGPVCRWCSLRTTCEGPASLVDSDGEPLA